MKHILSNITDSNGKIPVIGWVNPSAYPYDGEKGKRTQPVSRERLKDRYEEYKLAGFNTVFCMRDPIGANDKVVKQILSVCEELKLGCILIDALSYTREIPEERLKEIKEFVSGYTCFKGLLAYDEPGVSQFKIIGENCQKFMKYFPDKLFYVNLLPNYATPEQLGVKDYDEYVDKFVDETKVNFLTYDHYPFVHFSYGIVNNDKYFKNLSAVRMRAVEKNLPFMVFIETTAFIKNAHIPNRDEIAWQVNTALAYGAKGIQYFTYSMPSDTQETFSGAIIARDGTRTSSFDAVREVNARMRAVDGYLINAESKGVIMTGVTPKNEFGEHITIPDCDLITSYGNLANVEGGNTLTGCFDNDGEEGYFVVNNDFTSYGKVTLSFKEKATLLITRAEKDYTIEGCEKLELILNAGEGILIRKK